MNEFRLIACDEAGLPSEPAGDLPEMLAAAGADTAALHRRNGAFPPWSGYFAVSGACTVGFGAFVGPPSEGRVEIAYLTVPEFEGRGLATRTARALVAIARKADATLSIFAKTLKEENASTRILRRLGFQRIGMALDDDIGEAWAWLLEP